MISLVCLIALIAHARAAIVTPDSPLIRYVGRVQVSATTARFDWSGTTIRVRFSGAHLTATFRDEGYGDNHMDVRVDGVFTQRLNLTTTQRSFVLVDRANDAVVVVELFKSSEASFGIVSFGGFDTGSDGKLTDPPAPFTRRLAFVGDSITVGYGADGKEPCTNPPSWAGIRQDNYYAWGSVTARALQAEAFTTAWSGKGLIAPFDKPVGKDPDTAVLFFPRLFGSQQNSPAFNTATQVPDAVFIKLGCNDFNPSVPPRPTPDEWANTFVEFARNLTTRYYNHKDLPIFGACGPVCNNTCNTVQSAVNRAVSQGFNAHFINQMIAYPPANIGCQDHPNVAGHAAIAAATVPQVRKILGW
jgi:lysophospholipase L1-like esterase